MQFGFMHDKGTTDTIFTMRQLQEKHQAKKKKKKMYYAFVYLEKVVKWALRKLGVDEFTHPHSYGIVYRGLHCS